MKIKRRGMHCDKEKIVYPRPLISVPTNVSLIYTVSISRTVRHALIDSFKITLLSHPSFDFPVLLAISDAIVKQSRSEKLSHKNPIQGRIKGTRWKWRSPNKGRRLNHIASLCSSSRRPSWFPLIRLMGIPGKKGGKKKKQEKSPSESAIRDCSASRSCPVISPALVL